MKSSAPTSATRPWFPLENRPAYGEPTPIIEVEQLSLHYGQKPAFHDVTLSINKECITALVGPSGCGKDEFPHLSQSPDRYHPRVPTVWTHPPR